MSAPHPALCLHCILATAVTDFYRRYGRVDPGAGMRVVDPHDAIARLAEVTGEMIEALPSRPQHRVATAYAHDCLDAARTHARTGVPQPVVSGAVETEH